MPKYNTWEEVPTRTKNSLEAQFNIKSLKDFKQAVKDKNPVRSKFRYVGDPSFFEDKDMPFWFPRFMGRVRGITFKTAADLVESFATELLDGQPARTLVGQRPCHNDGVWENIAVPYSSLRATANYLAVKSLAEMRGKYKDAPGALQLSLQQAANHPNIRLSKTSITRIMRAVFGENLEAA